MALRVTKNTQQELLGILQEKGQEGLFRYVIGRSALEKRIDYLPEGLLLDRADAFFSLARTTNNEKFFLIGKILRRAAHIIYRAQHKTKGHAYNSRFLNLIK